MLTPPSAIETALQLRRDWTRPSEESAWPADAWKHLAEAGILEWTVPKDYGGREVSPVDVVAGAIELARTDLLTAFILTQFQAAVSRIVASSDLKIMAKWLPSLAKGDKFATVGISHLTTSRQHTAPAVLAAAVDGGYRVSGEVPWVTGADQADLIVTGATCLDGSQLLFVMPTDRPGIEILEPMKLLALDGSHTGPVRLTDVVILESDLLGPPRARALQQGPGAGTGSYLTSAIALGHALHAIDILKRDATSRPYLEPIARTFEDDCHRLRTQILSAVADPSSGDLTPELARAQATTLALHTTQSCLTTAKGAGFVKGHPVERIIREALFFLVWSCPQAVSSQLLQRFSQCESGD